jgi:hypothetical protein
MGLLDFTLSVDRLQETCGLLAGALGDMDYVAACFAQLLIEGQVSIGLLGVRLPSRQDYGGFEPSTAAVAAAAGEQYGRNSSVDDSESYTGINQSSSSNNEKSSWYLQDSSSIRSPDGQSGRQRSSSSRKAAGLYTVYSSSTSSSSSSLDFSSASAFEAADALLRAWKAAVLSSQHQLQHFGRVKGGGGSNITWADVHDVSSILHNFDGFITDDNHFITTSCHNLVTNTWWLTSSDLSLPFYRQQMMRWIPPVCHVTCPTSSTSSSTSSSSTDGSKARTAADEAAHASDSVVDDAGCWSKQTGQAAAAAAAAAAAEEQQQAGVEKAAGGTQIGKRLAVTTAAAAGGHEGPGGETYSVATPPAATGPSAGGYTLPLVEAPAAAAAGAVGVAVMATQAVVGLSTAAAFSAAAGNAVLAAAVFGVATAVAIAAVPAAAVAGVAAAAAVVTAAKLPPAAAATARTAHAATLITSEAAAAPLETDKDAVSIAARPAAPQNALNKASPMMPIAAAFPAVAAPACSEIVLHLNSGHYTLSIINHQQRSLLYFDSLGGTAVPKALTIPRGYSTTVLSFRAQSQATCGAHALFVALAYISDFQQLRSSCVSSASSSSSNRKAAGRHGQSQSTSTGSTTSSNSGISRTRASATAEWAGKHRTMSSEYDAGELRDLEGNSEKDQSLRHLRYGIPVKRSDRANSSSREGKRKERKRSLMLAGNDSSNKFTKHESRELGLEGDSTTKARQEGAGGADNACSPRQCLAACYFGTAKFAGGGTVLYQSFAGWADQLVSAAYKAVAK